MPTRTTPQASDLAQLNTTGRSATYSYDVLARLVSESISGDPNPTNNGSVNYSLDPVGNRLARTSTLAAIPATTSTYDANDRLTSDTYDPNGNTKTSSGANYAYNFENRLTSLDSAGSSVTFIYDGDGNRVGRTSGGVTTRYLVDELNPTGYAQVIEEITGGSVQRTYTYGHALISQNEIRSDQVSFFGIDAHGSVRLLTNTFGEVTDTYDYEGFGNVVNAFGSTRNDYLYSGEQFDPELGAYHLRERYYSQQRGRFLTSDPFAGFVEDPPTQHDYMYVGGDPINLVDPAGLAETYERVFLKTKVSIQTRLPCFKVIPSILVGAALPQLSGSFADAFDGPVRTRTFKPGDTLFRSPWPREAPSRPGKWFGTRVTVTKAGTDSLYNVKKWGNPLNKLRTFRFTKEVTVYYGKVAGGKGYQVLFPKNIDPCSVLKFVAEVALR